MKIMYANLVENYKLIAENICKEISMNKKIVLFLSGPMGAGKTTFCKFLVSYFGGSGVSSSSFGIINRILANRCILHCDFYRYQPDDDFVECEILPLLEDQYVLIIEWGNSKKLFIDTVHYNVSIEVKSDLSRIVTFKQL